MLSVYVPLDALGVRALPGLATCRGTAAGRPVQWLHWLSARSVNNCHRYAKSKDTDYKKVIRDNNLQLHSRSAVMETYGAFSKDLWSLVTVLTDPASHPHASGDYDPWCRPEPRRDFFLSLAFAAQRGGSKMLREAGKRRRDRRAAGRYATGTRA